MNQKTSIHLNDSDTQFKAEAHPPHTPGGESWGCVHIGDEIVDDRVTVFISSPAQLDALISAATVLRADLEKL